MDKSLLAVKNKSLKVWLDQAGKSNNEEIKSKFVNTLKEYRGLIAECWNSTEVSPCIISRFQALERILNELHNSSRLERAVFK